MGFQLKMTVAGGIIEQLQLQLQGLRFFNKFLIILGLSETLVNYLMAYYFQNVFKGFSRF